MAKRRRKSVDKRRTQREYHPYRSRRSLLSPPNKEQDLRRFRPEIDSYKKLDGRPVEYEVHRGPTDRSKYYPDYRIAFTDHKKVVVCARRKRRREHLFKEGKIGKGKKVSKIRRMRDDSKIVCKRR